MASTDELKTAVREALESRGVMSRLKAQVRAEVFKTLENQREERVELPEENLVINRLIKDYLLFNGYHCTHSVFLTETGEPKQEISTEFIAQEMSLLSPGESSVPLLYQMVAHFKKNETSHHKPHPPTTTTLSVNSEPLPSRRQGNQTSSKETATSHLPAIVMEGLKLN